MLAAIITGDIIRSTQMSEPQRTKLVHIISESLHGWQKEYEMRSEFFRGDSFQCIIQNPCNALKVALLLKMLIRSIVPDTPIRTSKKNNVPTNESTSKGFDARIAIGIGSIEPLSAQLATSSGEAFQLSGHLLDKIKNKKQALAIATNDINHPELETESILLDALISKTTALQCEVMKLKLQGHTEMEIAAVLKIAQSAVNQRSNGGNWNAIDSMVGRFEQIYSQ